MIGPRPICLGCRHWHAADDQSFTCNAYPHGIPAAIVENRADHRKPYRDDGGIRFAPVDGDAAAYAAEVFREGETT